MKRVVAICLLASVQAQSQAADFQRQTLGTPNTGSVVSGVNVISGWSCDSKNIEIFIDGVSIGKAGAGTNMTSMADPSRCGHADVGYALLYNFNNLTPGSHTVAAAADSVTFATNTFSTLRLDGVNPWLSGLSKEVTVSDFPSVGKTATLTWYQSYQNFVVTKVADSAPNQNYDKSRMLVGGTWTLVFTIGSTSSFTQSYTFLVVDPTPSGTGTYFALGSDQYADSVVGGYSPSLDLWTLLQPGSIIDRYFTFTFTDSNHISGCYYQVNPPGSTNLSSCYPMTGARIGAGIGTIARQFGLKQDGDRAMLNEVMHDASPIVEQPEVVQSYQSARDKLK